MAYWAAQRSLHRVLLKSRHWPAMASCVETYLISWLESKQTAEHPSVPSLGDVLVEAVPVPVAEIGVMSVATEAVAGAEIGDVLVWTEAVEAGLGCLPVTYVVRGSLPDDGHPSPSFFFGASGGFVVVTVLVKVLPRATVLLCDVGSGHRRQAPAPWAPAGAQTYTSTQHKRPPAGPASLRPRHEAPTPVPTAPDSHRPRH